MLVFLVDIPLGVLIFGGIGLAASKDAKKGAIKGAIVGACIGAAIGIFGLVCEVML